LGPHFEGVWPQVCVDFKDALDKGHARKRGWAGRALVRFRTTKKKKKKKTKKKKKKKPVDIASTVYFTGKTSGEVVTGSWGHGGSLI